MARLIDVDPILTWANDPEVYEPYGVRGSELMRKLLDAPTIDAVEVVHGEWKERETFHNADDNPIIEEWQSARCSVCNKYHTTPYMYYFSDYNFCPNCGARMKGADDE